MTRPVRTLEQVNAAEAERRRLRTSLLLVADHRPEKDIERRRGDCARLATCETNWSVVHGGEQAQCLPRCDGYARASLRDVVSGGGGGLVSMSGQ